jgi:hypothetical protein
MVQREYVYYIVLVISEGRLPVALLGWFFFCNQFYRSILLFVHGLSCAACEVLICSSLLCDCPYVYIVSFLSVCYVWAFPGRPSLYCHSDVLHTKIFLLSVCCYWLTIVGNLSAWLNLSVRINNLWLCIFFSCLRSTQHALLLLSAGTKL